MAPSTSSFSRCVTCSAKSAESGSASWRASALASLARWRSSSRRLSSRSRTALVSTAIPQEARHWRSGRARAAALIFQPLLQFVEGLDELGDALAFQLLRHGIHVDVEALEPLAGVAAFGDMALEAQFRTPEAPVGVDRLERH